MVEASLCAPRGFGSNSQSGKLLRLWVQSLARTLQEAVDRCFSPLSLMKYDIVMKRSEMLRYTTK